MLPLVNNLQSLFYSELQSRLAGWIRVRLITAVFLFLLSLVFRPTLALPYPIVPILALVLLLTGFNAFSHFFLNQKHWTPWLMYLQIAMDLFVITGILQSTGGVDSPFNWFYLLLIVAVGLVGGFKLTLLVTLLSIALYTMILAGQYYFYLPHYHVGQLATHADVGFRDLQVVGFNLIITVFAFLATGVVAGYVAEMAEQRKKQIESASRLYQEAILKNVTVAQEEERKRIARELHDETGQLLTSLMLNLQYIEEDSCLSPRLKDKIHNLTTLAASLLQSLRTAISNLRPATLDDLGLVPSIKWYLKNSVEPLGIKSTVVVYGEPRRVEEAVEISLYRVIQEAVTNVVKHALAHEIMIICRFDPGRIKIVVQDDGQGFKPAELPDTNKWGIVGMRERIAMLGGSLEISSSAAEGTTVAIEVPC